MVNTYEIALELVKKIQETQNENIDEASALIAETFMAEGKFFVTGSGHSHTVAEEFYGRAGGLAFTVPILVDELTLTTHPQKSTYLERLEGYAPILAELYKISAGDVVFIASNSGRNAFPVEMAMYAKEAGAKVIALTNIKHSTSVTSRHSSGKKLMDLADVIIDNCGELGDAATVVEGVNTEMYPTSSISNSIICGAVSVKVAEYLVSKGVEAPVFRSGNVDGSEDFGKAYKEKYMRLFY
jgi:uncharacterized phosphosugar-binding protein